MLNEEGMTSGMKEKFTVSKIQWIRYAYDIASGCPQGPGACEGTAERWPLLHPGSGLAKLNVNISTIVAWCKTGRLDGIQSAPHGPWWIKLTPEVIAQESEGGSATGGNTARRSEEKAVS